MSLAIVEAVRSKPGYEGVPLAFENGLMISMPKHLKRVPMAAPRKMGRLNQTM